MPRAWYGIVLGIDRPPVLSSPPPAEIVQALSERAVAVRGTQVATIGMPRLAHQPVSLRKQRDEVAREVERHCKRTLSGWSRPTWREPAS